METTEDPFQACEDQGCAHDLSVGVLVSDLLSSDGPHPTRRAGDGGDYGLVRATDHLPEAA